MVRLFIRKTFLDAIIKRKLLIEGESGIDDKRFAMLLKDYLHWSTSDDAVEIKCVIILP